MQTLILAIAGFGGLGVYLLLPRARTAGGGQRAGAGTLGWWLCGAALLLLWILWASCFHQAGTARAAVFYPLATLAVVGAVMTVTRRSPVACALWFATVVLGTAGLFLLLGAQFLAAATVIVYAGAIVVMFLFVIMLAQQRGTEVHDRVAREPELAVAAAFALLAVLVLVFVSTYWGSSTLLPVPGSAPEASEIALLDDSPAAPHVAALGTALFAEHWLSIELAGTLLLVAMVAAIVIVGRGSRERGAGSGAGADGGQKGK